MRRPFTLVVVVLLLGSATLVRAQNEPESTQLAAPDAEPAKEKPDSTVNRLKEAEKKLQAKAEDEVSKLAKTIDQEPMAKKVSAGILEPIYQVAQALAFPAFHWVAFALMSAGVFSFALQLVLGKLVVLTRMGFSLKEIISDGVSLAISVIGLVLTTQAAAQNSSFTQSPAAVISATVVGAVAGIILYRWGQSQELEAVAGRSRQSAPSKK